MERFDKLYLVTGTQTTASCYRYYIHAYTAADALVQFNVYQDRMSRNRCGWSRQDAERVIPATQGEYSNDDNSMML